MDASGHPVEQFEAAFQNCISALTTHEHFNVTDSDEVKSSVDQNVNKFLTIARQLEACFLEKRQFFAYHKPEDSQKDEIIELKQELARKEALIARHHEKLQHWQNMLSRPHSSSQQQQQHQTTSGVTPAAQATPAMTGGTASGAQGAHAGAQGGGVSQGPLAYLEQTTSSIGLPGR